MPNLLGGALTPDTLDSTARSINNWYASQGYVMNSVTGATLVPNKGDNTQGRVELKVRETKLSNSKSKAVVIRFVEKCNDESAAGEDVINIPIQTYSQHSNSEDKIQEYQKYRITSGRTRPLKLARMVGLAPGSDFRINPERWSRIVAFPRELFGGGQTNNGSTGSESAIFSTIHAVRPIPEEDGTVSIEIIATENRPFVSLEYGVTKSLYSDQWEGEFDLKHGNAFGGGEVAAINVKKGRNNLSKVDSSRDHSVLGGWNQLIKDGPLSWRMSVSDDHFGGSNSGYDLEIFRDFVGEAKESEQSATSVERTGATMRLRLPQRVLTRAVSASFEQIDNSNTEGAPMQSASLSINVGPVSFLRSGLSALLTAGVQRDDRAEDIKSGTEDRSFMQPYFRGTVTSQKILPLCKSTLESEQSTRSSLDLALRHVVSMSTKHLPRHDAITLGFSSRVRGYKYSPGPISSKRKNWTSFLQLNNAGGVQPPVAISNSISGNIELRLPFRPFFANKNLCSLTSLLEGKFVAFGDWAFTQEAESISDSKFNRFSSVGAGYRKNIQGLPLKLDAVLTEHGTGGLFFGIGRDFGG
jgi:outer membrane protein assembly factor BamA